MIGELFTCDHAVYRLPPLLEWEIVRTGGVPCDSFSVTFPYTAEMGEVLGRAVSFLAMDGGTAALHAVVDETVIEETARGRVAAISGRGAAARLLDNESRPVTYAAATLREILQNHVTPYGIVCGEAADVRAASPYTVASGTSQWRALEEFCRAYGGFSPRFTADGTLLASPPGAGGRLALSDTSAILSLTRRDNRYGVLSEVLVIDKTRNASYSVKNEPAIRRGGQCRRVVYTPGQSTWAAMRYTGEYQIARSAEEAVTLHVRLSGRVRAEPGDRVELSLRRLGLQGVYRVQSVESRCSPAEGETTGLAMKEES